LATTILLYTNIASVNFCWCMLWFCYKFGNWWELSYNCVVFSCLLWLKIFL